MNTNKKRRNKSLNLYINSQKEKPKLIPNSLKSNIYKENNEYENFQSTVSNIAKQLNNFSLKAYNMTNNNHKKIIYKIDKIICFNIKGIKSNNINIINLCKNDEILKENENLKENIKFLLGQIKKYQKSGIVIEQENKNNDNIDKIKERFNKEIKLNKKRILFLENENRYLKEKYDNLKFKYKLDAQKIIEKNKIFRLNNNIQDEEISKLNYSETENDINSNTYKDLNKNQLYQYIKKNYQIENSKNENNFNQKNFTFHKTHHTTDFSNYFLLENENKNKKEVEKTGVNDNKYINLKLTSADKYANNYKFPKTTKSSYNKYYFLYKKTPIKNSNINKSISKNISYNYFNIKKKENKKLSDVLYHKKNNTFTMKYNNRNNIFDDNQYLNIYIPTSSYTSSKLDTNENNVNIISKK